jgi:hypothetical protein
VEVAVKGLGLVAVLVLTGCVDSQATSDSVFALYRGKPIETVIARWGPPETVMRQSSGTIYVFTSSTQYRSTAPTTTAGMIGNVPVAITTNVPITDTLSCREQVHTDTAGRIVFIGGTGNNGACDAMLKQLK